jgi:hypothetical protein
MIYLFFIVAVCSTACLHGGTCIAPNICECKKLNDNSFNEFLMLYFDQFKGATGYTGDICQERMC